MSIAHLTRMRANLAIIIQPLEKFHVVLMRDAMAIISPIDDEEIAARRDILDFLDALLLDVEAAEAKTPPTPKLRSV